MSNVGARAFLWTLVISLSWLVWLSSLAPFAFAASRPAFLRGDYLAGPALRDAATDAARIARIRITGRSAVVVDGSQRRCGFLYDAIVVEAFKGEGTAFQFFAGAEEEFAGFDRNYLIFAYRRDPRVSAALVNMLRVSIPQAQMPEIVCRLAPEVYVPSNFQALRAFDTDATEMFGGEWLAPTNRSDLSWCVYDASKPQQSRMQTREKRNGDSSTSVMSWASAIVFIREALENPRQDVSC